MKIIFSSLIAHSTGFLLGVFLLFGSHQTSEGAGVNFKKTPCPEGSIVIQQLDDSPLGISVRSAECTDFSSNVDLTLKNQTTKTIVKYEISSTEDYENQKGFMSGQMRSGVIVPGAAVSANENGGIVKSQQKISGVLKKVIIKLLWVKFSDGTLWGEDYGRSDPKNFPGYDLTLRDSSGFFNAAFNFKDNGFGIESGGEYGFGGPGFQVETAGCQRHITFTFPWSDFDFSYHPRKNPTNTIIIKAGDKLHGDIVYDSCTKIASGIISDENQNIVLTKFNGASVEIKAPL